MNRFLTLMQREWLQHRTGWRVLMAAPTALIALLTQFEGRGMHVRIDGESASMPPMDQLPLVLQTMAWTFATVMLSLVLVVLAVLAQMPGLARRDVQDRSIEFWLSLPTSHAQSLGATLLMHLLLLPALALSAALLGAQAVAMLAIVSHQGFGAWLQQPWWQLLPTLLVVALRIWLGLLLAVAWLSPLLLVTLAASAWLKRWAIPVVSAVLLLGVHWLDPRLAVPLVKPALARLMDEAGAALLASRAFVDVHLTGPRDLADLMPALSGLLLRDALAILGRATAPAFALALLLSAAGFSLLVLRRQRNG